VSENLTGWRYYWRLFRYGGEGGLMSWSPDPDFPECPACHRPIAVVQFYLSDFPHWLCLDCQATGTVPGWPKGRRRNKDRFLNASGLPTSVR